MRKWNLPLTYEPKIQAVLDGRCTQTIRAGRKIQVGDLISFHGWAGKPYRSPWSFRTPYWEVIESIDLHLHGSKYHVGKYMYPILWTNDMANDLAARDFIDPPTGIELGRLLCSMHKIGPEGLPAQIIRWRYE